MSDPLEFTAPIITVNGSVLPESWVLRLVSMRTEQALCLVGRTVLRFIDPGYTLSVQTKFHLGAEVKITLANNKVLFTGVVTGASLERRAGADPDYVVTVDDLGHQLTLKTTSHSHLTGSYLAVVEEVAKSSGLTARVSGAGMSASTPYLLQTGSNLALIDELTRRAGCVWWVDGKVLTVSPMSYAMAPAATLSFASDDIERRRDLTLLEFSLRATGLRPTTVSATGWNVDKGTDLAATAKEVSTVRSDFLGGYLGNAPGQKLAGGEVSVASGNPDTDNEASMLADAMNAEWAAGAVVARGVCGVSAAIALMAAVEIKNAGPSSGTFVITQVEHVYRRDGFVTRFTAGPLRPTSLADTLGRPAPESGLSINGLQAAEVTNNDDPDKLGRVKVRFKGLQYATESTWARVVTFGGGKNRGAVFQPEVGDEVLVGFERSDTRHPVVIGGLYSPKTTLPEAGNVIAGGKVTHRRITSRLGHAIELADGTGPTDQHILLVLDNGTHKIRIGADKLDIETAAGKPISIKSGGSSFQIDAGGNITISGKRIAINAELDLTVQGQSVAVKGKTQTSVEGAVVDIKGSATTNVQASGPLALKGAIVKIN